MGTRRLGSIHAEPRTRGFTVIEMAISVAVMSVFLVSILASIAGSQSMVVQDHALSQLQIRAQNALERIVRYASQAVTSDPMFQPFEDSTGVGSHGLRFRLIDTVTTSGSVLYDDAMRVYIYGGPTADCAGVVILRGPEYDTIVTQVAGDDGLLGTTDDDTNHSFDGANPALELLLTDAFRPSTGEMLSIDIAPPPIGRAIKFTLRLNVRDRKGDFLLKDDLVLTQSVALRQ